MTLQRRVVPPGTMHWVEVIQTTRKDGTRAVRAWCGTCYWKSGKYKFRGTAERWAQKHTNEMLARYFQRYHHDGHPARNIDEGDGQ